jgi:hypothetical protein
VRRTEVCHIDIADDLSAATTRLEHAGAVFERRESPVLALFSAAAELVAESGVVPRRFVVTFRDVGCSWRPESGVWPPTFDTYALIAAVVDSWHPADRTAWDLGCGTGVIGIHLLHLTPCEHVTFTDLDPLAVADTRANLSGITCGVTTRVERFPDDTPLNGRWGVLVSNPPYFPPGFLGWEHFGRQATDHAALTPAILRHGPHYARRVVFAASSAAFGPGGPGRRVLARWRLPLNVPGLYRSADLSPGVYREGPDPAVDLWHDVFICELAA